MGGGEAFLKKTEFLGGEEGPWRWLPLGVMAGMVSGHRKRQKCKSKDH